MILHPIETYISRQPQLPLRKNLDALPYLLLARILSYVSVKDFWAANKVCKHISYTAYYLFELIKKTSIRSEVLLGKLLNETSYMRRGALIHYIHRKCTEPSPDIDKLINLIPKIEHSHDEADAYKDISIYFIHNGN